MSTDTERDSGTTPEGRRDPRYAVTGRITCDLLPAYIRMTLLNVSRGGCLIRSPRIYRVGDVHRFRFTVEAERDAIFVLHARVVHCAPVTTDGCGAYFTGLEFLDRDNPVCHRAIDFLVAMVVH